MKIIKNKILLLILVSTLLTLCIFLYNIEVERNLFLQQAEYTDVKSLPRDYTPKMAVDKGDVVIIDTSFYNKEKLDKFLYNIDNKKHDKIQIVTYTKEGYPLIEQLYYSNEEITLITDNTRHTLINKENKGINTYKVVNIVKQCKEKTVVYVANLLNGESFDIAYFKK